MMSNKNPSAEDLIGARLGHLNMIQGVVSRLATFSASAKNFCITVLAALIGVAFQQNLPWLFLAAAFVVISFAALDVYYLAQERRFRELYSEVAARTLVDASQFDMSPSSLTVREYGMAIRSFSTGGFYLLLLIACIALSPFIHARAEEHEARSGGGVFVVSQTPCRGQFPEAAASSSTSLQEEQGSKPKPSRESK